MRGKSITPALLACTVLALCTVLLAPGCGSRTKNSAQEILEKADHFVNSVDSDVDKLSTDVKALARSIKEGTAITAGMVEQTYGALKSQAQKVVDDVRVARQEIKDIISGTASGGYQKYLGIQNEILDSAASLTETLGDVFSQLAAAADSLSAGKAPEVTALSRTAEDWLQSFDDIREKVRGLVDEARRLKQEGDL
jgi:ElaB/YqjD/DUF883 family membrane-anchored ribosome-binding protein